LIAFHLELKEFPAAATLEREYADEACGPTGDMSNIEKVYISSGGCFWTLCKGDQAVGMVGLEIKSQDVGELRRMHLSEETRGKGAGTVLVKQLLTFAAKKVVDSCLAFAVDFVPGAESRFLVDDWLPGSDSKVLRNMRIRFSASFDQAAV
jgi:hypothetical protein